MKNKILLYHYSNKNFKGFIRPDFFGLNSYSQNSGRISGVKRSYFYLKPSSREIYLQGAEFLYIAEVKPSRLYNIDKDPLKLVGQYNDIISEVKRRGYLGLLGNNGFGCAVLFYPVKIKQRKTLTEPGRYAILK